MKRKIVSFFALGLILTLVFSVGTTSAAESDVELTISFSNLAELSDDHYEGWLIVDGSPISTGKFLVGSDGSLTDLDGDAISKFTVSAVDLDLATKFVLSVEPPGDTDSTPSAIKPLAGDLNAAKNSASLAHTIGVDFTSVSGAYILATPTNGDGTDENSGIWWLNPTVDPFAPGLDLPDLTNTDWIYEGWVVIDGVAVTTGTFNTTAGVDDSDPYSSTQGGPPFPGEDFLVNAPTGVTFPTNIAGGKAVISIEPRMDNSPAPFQFKPVVGDIPSDAVDHVLYTMTDMSSTLATGSVTVSEASDEDDSPGFTFIGLMAFLAVGVIVKRLQTNSKKQ